ncbi:MAG: ABC transporter substrate-binding protein, partial [Gaiellaceae bacterium]
MRKLLACGGALVAALAFTVPGALGGAEQTPGVTAKRIVIGGTFPLTGPAAAYAPIPLGMKAYFSHINARRGPDGKRGVMGRQIVWKYYDDVFNIGGATPQLTRRLVEQD